MIKIEVKEVPKMADISFNDKVAVNNLNYESLTNKPKLNNVTLEGNKSLEEIGITPISNIELLNLLK